MSRPDCWRHEPYIDVVGVGVGVDEVMARQRLLAGVGPPLSPLSALPGSAAGWRRRLPHCRQQVSMRRTDALAAQFHGRPCSAELPAPSEQAPPAVELAADSSEFDYKVMYLLEAVAIGNLREGLVALGGNVAIIGDNRDSWTIHLHCNDADAALAAGHAHGELQGVAVTRLHLLRPSGNEGSHVLVTRIEQALAPREARNRSYRTAGFSVHIDRSALSGLPSWCALAIARYLAARYSPA